MELHFYDSDIYATYATAKEANALTICEAPASEDQVMRWGFRGGILCDAMNTVQAALKAAGAKGKITAVLFDGDQYIATW